MHKINPRLFQTLDSFSLDKSANGLVRIFSFNPKTGEIRHMVEKHNLILYSGADILAQLITGNAKYAINTMYLEFKNLADPSDPITPPAYDRSGGVAYYAGLSGSADTDFLRVPLVLTPTIASSNDVLYDGNQVTFFGQSEGTEGFYTKPFNPSVNSAVYGAALVSAPDFEDQSQDKVFSRVYSGIDKVLKEAGFEIGVTWTIRFN